MTIQVAPDDCTGCGICVETCPAHSKEEVKHRSINLEPKADHLDRERERFDFFLTIPELDRTLVEPATVKGSQALQPLFEYSGACEGCGETPYLKLLTQLFGDRLLVANATGCSSIYGGNLPTTPWTTGRRRPRPCVVELAVRGQRGVRPRDAPRARRRSASRPRRSSSSWRPTSPPSSSAPISRRRPRSPRSAPVSPGCSSGCVQLDTPEARRLEAIARTLVRTSVWIVGGDGWAYDIGFGGLDHVLASGANVNVLVLDTEVYSNTGGQASKATPRGAVAKYAAGGKQTRKKDLGQIASAYGHVYVAQVALGADNVQTVKALAEAEAWDGPVARDRLQPLHRPRDRHGEGHGSAEASRRQRLLAALALRPSPRRPRRAPVPPRRPRTEDPRSPSSPTGRRASPSLARSRPQEAERLAELLTPRRRRAPPGLRAARGGRARPRRRPSGGRGGQR